MFFRGLANWLNGEMGCVELRPVAQWLPGVLFDRSTRGSHGKVARHTNERQMPQSAPLVSDL
jgi:hypothetical protein